MPPPATAIELPLMPQVNEVGVGCARPVHEALADVAALVVDELVEDLVVADTVEEEKDDRRDLTAAMLYCYNCTYTGSSKICP